MSADRNNKQACVSSLYQTQECHDSDLCQPLPLAIRRRIVREYLFCRLAFAYEALDNSKGMYYDDPSAISMACIDRCLSEVSAIKGCLYNTESME
jgi:hypothetical protein